MPTNVSGEFMEKDYSICIYCEHFKLQNSKEEVTIFSHGICDSNKTTCIGCDKACDKFILKSGFHINKIYI